jgi:hypothetical protein
MSMLTWLVSAAAADAAGTAPLFVAVPFGVEGEQPTSNDVSVKAAAYESLVMSVCMMSKTSKLGEN